MFVWNPRHVHGTTLRKLVFSFQLVDALKAWTIFLGKPREAVHVDFCRKLVVSTTWTNQKNSKKNTLLQPGVLSPFKFQNIPRIFFFFSDLSCFTIVFFLSTPPNLVVQLASALAEALEVHRELRSLGLTFGRGWTHDGLERTVRSPSIRNVWAEFFGWVKVEWRKMLLKQNDGRNQRGPSAFFWCGMDWDLVATWFGGLIHQFIWSICLKMLAWLTLEELFGTDTTNTESTARKFQESVQKDHSPSTWNPNDHCFDWKRPCFGGFNHQNRGQRGSRQMSFFCWLTPNYWCVTCCCPSQMFGTDWSLNVKQFPSDHCMKGFVCLQLLRD